MVMIDITSPIRFSQIGLPQLKYLPCPEMHEVCFSFDFVHQIAEAGRMIITFQLRENTGI